MKNELRKNCLELRKKLDTKSLSEKIIEKLVSLPEYINSKNIICYYPLKYEVSTLNCFKDDDKNWYLPKVDGKILKICPYCGELKHGTYNIMEPQTESIKSFDNIDMIIIPAVGADKNGYRLGYGKGYYDRLLTNLPSNIYKVTLVFSDCLKQSVYPEKFDQKSNIVITDKEVLRI